MINQAYLKLFQFCDSQFPTGAFSHSFGLETYIQRGDVHDGASLERMAEDTEKFRKNRPFAFTNLKTDEGLDDVLNWIKKDIFFEGLA